MKPCPEGKVRNPATNRCIKIESLKSDKSYYPEAEKAKTIIALQKAVFGYKKEIEAGRVAMAQSQKALQDKTQHMARCIATLKSAKKQLISKEKQVAKLAIKVGKEKRTCQLALHKSTTLVARKQVALEHALDGIRSLKTEIRQGKVRLEHAVNGIKSLKEEMQMKVDSGTRRLTHALQGIKSLKATNKEEMQVKVESSNRRLAHALRGIKSLKASNKETSKQVVYGNKRLQHAVQGIKSLKEEQKATTKADKLYQQIRRHR